MSEGKVCASLRSTRQSPLLSIYKGRHLLVESFWQTGLCVLLNCFFYLLLKSNFPLYVAFYKKKSSNKKFYSLFCKSVCPLCSGIQAFCRSVQGSNAPLYGFAIWCTSSRMKKEFYEHFLSVYIVGFSTIGEQHFYFAHV